MEKYLANKNNDWYDKPDDVVGVLVDPISGSVTDIENKKSKIFYFLAGTEPNDKSENDLEMVWKEKKEENIEY